MFITGNNHHFLSPISIQEYECKGTSKYPGSGSAPRRLNSLVKASFFDSTAFCLFLKSFAPSTIMFPTPADAWSSAPFAIRHLHFIVYDFHWFLRHFVLLVGSLPPQNPKLLGGKKYLPSFLSSPCLPYQVSWLRSAQSGLTTPQRRVASPFFSKTQTAKQLHPFSPNAAETPQSWVATPSSGCIYSIYWGLSTSADSAPPWPCSPKATFLGPTVRTPAALEFLAQVLSARNPFRSRTSTVASLFSLTQFPSSVPRELVSFWLLPETLHPLPRGSIIVALIINTYGYF